MPDIDIDFAADRREELIQYVYARYGAEHTAMVCNINTFRERGADNLTRIPEEARAALVGLPHHLSIHVGGMLITAEPLDTIVPRERATMPGRVVVQWDKDSVEDAGLIKIDLLGLRTLGWSTRPWAAPRPASAPLQLPGEQDGGGRPSPSRPFTPPVRGRHAGRVSGRVARPDAECCRASRRGASRHHRRGRARARADQGNMVHPYLRRRAGLEPVSYAHPALEPVLGETLGVILFQEQVLRVAMVVAGFSGGEAGALRRALSRALAGRLRQLRALAGAEARADAGTAGTSSPSSGLRRPQLLQKPRGDLRLA
jgi:error-prone DNA polymerase